MQIDGAGVGLDIFDLAIILWSCLDYEFSKDVVDYYFMTISLESVMFDLNVDSVFDLISLRKNNNKVPFVELLKKLK